MFIAAPTFVSNSSQETCIGCVGQVTCEIFGYPRPNRTSWMKDGNYITSNSRCVKICISYSCERRCVLEHTVD